MSDTFIYGKGVNPGRLKQEIDEDAGISIPLETIYASSGVNSIFVEIKFNDNLSVPEEGVLSGIVSSHIPIRLPKTSLNFDLTPNVSGVPLVTQNSQFGGYCQHIKLNGEYSTGSTTYVSGLHLVTSEVPAGDYLITSVFEGKVSKNAKQAWYKITLDGEILSEISPELRQDAYFLFNNSRMATINSGIHTIDFDYKTPSAVHNAFFKDVELQFWKVN